MRPEYLWRIEDKNGIGPYNGTVHTAGFRDHEANPTAGFDPTLSNPKRVISDYIPTDFFGDAPKALAFAFSSPDQLKAWFADRETITEERWAELGYHVTAIKLDDRPICQGVHQTLFFASVPKPPMATLPLDDIWSMTSDQMLSAANAALAEEDYL